MKEDITFYYDVLKKNIKIVEENKSDRKALGEVTYAFNNIFEYIKLFLIEKKERYYGYILMSLRLEIAYDRPIIAAVSIDTSPFTLITNPLLIGKYSIKEMIFIICHEIEHLVLDHPAEGLKINQTRDRKVHFRLNLAMDASVNDRLKMEISKYHLNMMSAPNDCVTSEVLSIQYGRRMNELESFLYYYDIIKGLKEREGTEYGYLEDEVDSDIPSDVIIISNGKAINDIITNKDLKNKKIIVLWSNDDSSDNAHEKVREFIKNVMDGIEDENKRRFPGYQMEAIEKLLAPPVINWGNVLKRYIGMIPNSYKKTKMRINRRQPLRYDVPGRMDNRTVRLVVAIDTSASMSEEQIKRIFTEIFAILKNTKFELTIIECDCKIQNIYTAKTMRDINFKVKGRGGTSFTPVIDYINANRRFRECVLIYFTDGEGEASIPKPYTYRNLWVLVNTEWLSLDEPYGDILELNMEE